MVVDSLERRMHLAVDVPVVPTWTDRGPFVATGVPGDSASNLASADTTDVVVDRLDSNTAFLTTAGNGIWKTTDFRSAAPTWSRLTDGLRAVSFTAIAQGPISGNLYAAAGDVAGSGVFKGGGIYRSTDGGGNWKRVGGAAMLGGQSVRSIVVTRQVANGGSTFDELFVTGDFGVARSTNSGQSFQVLSGLVGPGFLPTGNAGDVAVDPRDARIVYAAVYERDAEGQPTPRIYATQNAGSTWAPIAQLDALHTDGRRYARLRLAVGGAASFASPATIAVAYVNADGELTRARLVRDVRPSYAAAPSYVVSAIDFQPGGAVLTPASEGLDFTAIAIDPGNTRRVFISGDQQTGSGSPSGTPVWAVEFTDAAILPQPLLGNSAPRRFTRELIALPAIGADPSRLLAVTSGGVYMRSDPLSSSTNWVAAHRGIGGARISSIAYDSKSDVILGAAEDVGVIESRSGGSGTRIEYQAVLPGSANTQRIFNTPTGGVRYSISEGLRSFSYLDTRISNPVRQTMTFRALAGAANYSGLTIDDQSTTDFIPFDVGASPAELTIGYRHLYATTDFGQTVTDITPAGLPTGFAFRSIVSGAEPTDSTPGGGSALYAVGRDGTSNLARLIARAASTSVSAYTQLPIDQGNIVSAGRTMTIPRDIAIDPTNVGRLVVVGEAERLDAPGKSKPAVFVNVSSGTGAWIDITGELDQFTDVVTTAIIYRAAGSGESVVVVGGRNGVYARVVDAATGAPAGNWSRIGVGVDGAVVSDLTYNNDVVNGTSRDRLIIGTWGGGVFTLDNASQVLGISSNVVQSYRRAVVTGTPGNDTLTLRRNASDVRLIDLALNSDVPVSVPSANITSIVATLQGGTNQIVVDQANGRIDLGMISPGGNTQLTEINKSIASQSIRLFNGIRQLGEGLVKLFANAGSLLKKPIPGVGATNVDSAAADTGESTGRDTSIKADPSVNGSIELLTQSIFEPVLQLIREEENVTVDAIGDTIRFALGTLPGISLFKAGNVSVQTATTSQGSELQLAIDNFSLVKKLFGRAVDFSLDGLLPGIDLSGDAKLDVTAKLSGSLQVGFNLSSGLSPLDALYIKTTGLQLSASASANNLDVSARIGFLKGQVIGGTISASPSVNVSLNNPDGDIDGRITLREIVATPGSSLLQINAPVAPASLVLPIASNLPGLNLLVNPRPTIRVTTPDVFSSAPQVKLENFEPLANFRSFSASSVFDAMTSIVNFLKSIKEDPKLNVSLPFAGNQKLGDLLAWVDGLSSKMDLLRTSSGAFVFDSPESFAQKLTEALGANTAIQISYDAPTKQLRFAIAPSASVNSTYPFAFGNTATNSAEGVSITGLKPTAGATGAVTVNGSLGATLNLAFDLSASFVGTTTLPANGQPGVAFGSSIQFSVKPNNISPAHLIVVPRNAANGMPQTSDNASPEDLIADVNAALANEGIGNDIQAILVDGKLGFQQMGANLFLPLTLTVGANSGLIGIASSQTVNTELSDRIWINSGSMSGSFNLNASVADAEASLGFFAIGVHNATGSAAGSIAVSFNNGQPVKLSQLLTQGTTPTNLIDITINGSASLVLPIDLNVLGVNLTGLTGTPVLRIGIGDITSPNTASLSFDAFQGGINPLQKLAKLNVQQVISVIRQLADYLVRLAAPASNSSAFTTKLPVVDKSLSELIGYAQTFTQWLDALANDPSKTIQAFLAPLNASLRTAFGLPGSAVPLTLGFDGDALKFALDISRGWYGNDPLFSYSLPFNFDVSPFKSLLPDSLLGDLVNITGQGTIAASAGYHLKAAVGVRFADLTPVIYDSTGIEARARFVLTGPKITANLGPLTATSKNYVLAADADGNAATVDYVQLNLGLKDLTGSQRYYTIPQLVGTQANTSAFDASLTGQLRAILPLNVQGVELNPALSLTVTDLGDPFNPAKTTFTAPDLQPLLSAFQPSLNAASVIRGLDSMLRVVQDLLERGVFGSNLPLFGRNLSNRDAAKVIGDFRSAISSALAISQGDLTAVRSVLFGLLGPAGINVITDRDASGVVDINDIVVKNQSTSDVYLLISLGKSASFNSQRPGMPTPSIDLGLPGLGFKAASEIQGTIGFTLDLGFGIDSTRGFYLRTDDTHIGGAIDLNLTNTALAGRLGLLQFTAVNRDEPVRLAGTVSAGLKDFSLIGGVADNKLYLEDLTTGQFPPIGDAFTASVVGTVRVPLNLTLTAINPNTGDVLPGAPKLSSEFLLDWSPNFNPVTGSDLNGVVPRVEFNHVRLEVGAFFANYVSPVVERINQILEPIRPVIDFLTKPLPVVSQIRGKDTSLLDLAGEFENLSSGQIVQQQSSIAAFKTLLSVADFAQKIGAATPMTQIDLGSYRFGTIDARSLANASSLDVNSLVRLLVPTLNDVFSQLNGFTVSVDGSNVGQQLQAAKDVLSFPILNNPASAMGLFLGQDADLLRFNPAPIRFGVHFDQFVNILGPLGIDIHANADISIRIDLGYDTSGLRGYINGGNADPANGWSHVERIFDGLYINDFDTQGNDVPELTLNASFSLGVGVGTGVVGISVNGGLFGTLGLDFEDPNQDGKVRFSEISDKLSTDPLSLFSLSGKIEAGLFVSAFLGPIRINWQLAKTTLIDFDVSPNGVTVFDESVSGGTLTVYLRDGVNDRLELSGVRTDAVSQTIRVRRDGRARDYSNITNVIVVPRNPNGATYDGNDSVTISPTVKRSVSISTGNGNDSITTADTGSAMSVLAGAGDDTITGAAQAETLNGEDGNDTIYLSQGDTAASIGADVAQGGNGDDVIIGTPIADTINGGDGNDTIDAGGGNDCIVGGAGDDQLNGGDGSDRIEGGIGADAIYADRSDADTLSATVGDDTVTGGDGDDTIVTGAGNDIVDAGIGNDVIAAEAGNDSVTASAGDDSIEAGDGNDTVLAGDGNDTIVGGAGVNWLFGEAGNDSITGSNQSESLYGGDGNDTVIGNGGADSLSGQAGSDSLVGGPQNDTLVGDIGNDLLIGNGAIDSFDGGLGDDYFTGGSGDHQVFDGDGADYVDLQQANYNSIVLLGSGFDTVLGGVGVDCILSGAGNDSIITGDSADTISSGDGNDTILSGAGADSVDSGAGNDFVLGGSENDSIQAGDGRDTVEGGSGGDRVWGGNGNDILIGGASAWTTPDGSDTLYGGEGFDYIQGDDAAIVSYIPVPVEGGLAPSLGVTLFGGSGDDQIYGDQANDPTTTTLLGSNDTVSGQGGADYLVGGPGDDALSGDAGDDDLLGDYNFIPANFLKGLGSDTLDGGVGADLLIGDHSVVSRTEQASLDPNGKPATEVRNVTIGNQSMGLNDTLRGGEGRDSIYGMGGNDSLSGEGAGDASDDDDLVGGQGADTITTNGGYDVVLGDSGVVQTFGPGVVPPLVPGSVNSINRGVTYINGAIAGSTYDDLITGTNQLWQAAGQEGDDTFSLSATQSGLIGSSTLAGGSGLIDNSPDNLILNANNAEDIRFAPSATSSVIATVTGVASNASLLLFGLSAASIQNAKTMLYAPAAGQSQLTLQGTSIVGTLNGASQMPLTLSSNPRVSLGLGTGDIAGQTDSVLVNGGKWTISADFGIGTADRLSVTGRADVRVSQLSTAPIFVELNDRSRTTIAGTVTTTSVDVYDFTTLTIPTGSLLVQQTMGKLYGQIDLSNGSMVVQSGVPSQIASLIQTGRNNGLWNGVGLINSVAASNSKYTVGMSNAAALGGSYSGTSLEPTAVVVRGTLAADANLDGSVNFDDLLVLAANYNQSGRSFNQGDANNDGVVNFEDLLILAAQYNSTI
jgi:Ca2+-binding RTX toxin-like protein